MLTISLYVTPATRPAHSVHPSSPFHCPSHLPDAPLNHFPHAQHFTVRNTCHTPHSLSSPMLTISLSVTLAIHPTHSVPHAHHFTVRLTCHTPHSLSSPMLTISLSVTPATRPAHSVPPCSPFHSPSHLPHAPLTQFPHADNFTVRHNCHTPHSLSSPMPTISLSVTLATHTTHSFHRILTISHPFHLPHAPFTQFPILTISLCVTPPTRPLTQFPHSHHFTVLHTFHTPHSLSSPILTISLSVTPPTRPTHSVPPF